MIQDTLVSALTGYKAESKMSKPNFPKKILSKSPRVLKRLEDAEDALKAQCQRKGHLTKCCLSKDQDI